MVLLLVRNLGIGYWTTTRFRADGVEDDLAVVVGKVGANSIIQKRFKCFF